jgi:putative membrane protein
VAAALLLGLAACQRQTPLGAEAAWQAADQPRPVLVAAVPQAAPIPDAQAFVSQAGASDAFEIAAAQTAAQRAQNPDVRVFAAVMIHDHSDSSADLKAALAEAGQSLSPSSGPTPDQQARLEALRSADPKVFDKTYIDGQVQAHRAALAQLAAYAQNGQVVALSSFAANGAGMTQKHLAMAQSLDEQLP